ncbi:Signal transduction histidine kinase [Tenacibaculum sp. 190524A02b]|uniref:sensor histidine kinase n=1 Tax=Tenacibaculum vairaonense TaxID=3137860 RepID=UPI0032B184BD
MKTKLLTTTLLFSFLFSFAQEDKTNTIYNQICVISSKEKWGIEEVYHKFKDSNFTKTKLKKLYRKLGKKNWWLYIPVKKANGEQYLTFSFPYLAYGKLYLCKNDSIIPLHRTSYYKKFPYKYLFYRHPTWEIPSDSLNSSEVILKLKNGGSRTRLELHLETKNEFLKRTQTEYIQFGLFIAFLISMICILLFFSILKKEYSVLFYAVYIFCMVIEFLAGKGLGIQFIWSDYPFITKNIRSFTQTFAVFCMGFFYLRFYTFSKDETISKNIFKWGTILTIPLMLLYLYKYLGGGMVSLYLYVWVLLKIIIFIWFVNHIYLARKKRIPNYLVFAFAAPIVSIIISQSINPLNTDSNWWIYGTANIFYIALVIEILCFTRFIFNAVIQSQKKYTQLKKISDELKYSLQNKTIEIQEQERNKLLKNVHDSFGGYLEALKLRLLNKDKDTPKKIEEILNAFDNDYRYLLNNLYAPKINANNFIETLTEFIYKINNITNNIISYNISLENTQLSKEKCIHLYRIISELVTNAIKHSNANKIKIVMSKTTSNTILLEVNDNGLGFNTSKHYKSFGLQSIQERVTKMKGKFSIQSNKNLGTLVTIKVPENEEN